MSNTQGPTTIRGFMDQRDELVRALEAMDRYIADIVYTHAVGDPLKPVIERHKGTVTQARAAIQKARG